MGTLDKINRRKAMDDWTLKRYSYSNTETEGRLYIPGLSSNGFATIERPWIPGKPGGRPFESCIPDGTYKLIPHLRPDDGDDKPDEEVYALVNPYCGVYHYEDDVPPQGGRFLILVHVGNWVTNVVGCIAPGLIRRPMVNPKTGNLEQAVASSGAAMKLIRRVPRKERRIHIVSATGASQ